jgi:Hint module
LFSNANIQAAYDLWVMVENEASSSDWNWKETGVVFPAPVPSPEPEPQPTPQEKCIYERNELVQAVNSCMENVNETSCRIDICSIELLISSASRQAIDISNKNILLRCDNECGTKRCILNGSGTTRMFYGSNTNITFLNIIFANGFHVDNGGAIKLENNSNATMINCSFVNNSAHSGSAVQMNNSHLTVVGTETSFVNNTGIGPPLEVLSSHLNISNAVFADNQVSEFEADIILFNSTLEIYDVHFLTTVQPQRCHVYYAMLATDFASASSCMTVDPSNKSYPFIDLTNQCIIVSPVPTPRPALCFSRENTVDVQDVGDIPISQLRIGDFVKSSNNKFTQVYGFGHLDHHRQGTFLHIVFRESGSTMTNVLNQATFLKISAHHLVMLERNNKHYPISAKDIKVGDILSGRSVQSIMEVVRQGVYAPLTQSGDVMVNGILASNYVNLLQMPSILDQHSMAHALFFPHRCFCHVFLALCKKEMYVNEYSPLVYLLVHGSNSIHTLC